MPTPLVLVAPALYEAAVAAVTAIGDAIGIIAVDEMVNEDEKADSDSKVLTTDSTRDCEKCPAITKVTPQQERFIGGIKNLNYQMKVCGTYSMKNLDDKTTVLEFIFRDVRLRNKTKQVAFDGWKPSKCLFLEAKGTYDQFFKNGSPWYDGAKSIIDQAARQQNAMDICDTIPQCHWHFMQPISFSYYSERFSIFTNITCFYSPEG